MPVGYYMVLTIQLSLYLDMPGAMIVFNFSL